MKRVQKFNANKIIRSGFFDKVILTGPRDLDKQFRLEHKQLLKYHYGGGYWIWKPYIIKKVLMTLKEQDFLFYVDADQYVTKPIEPFIELMMKWNQEIIAFEGKMPDSKEIYWTKRDLLLAMDCDKPQFLNTASMRGGLSLWKGGSSYALKFLDEWISYCENEHLLTDIPSKVPNYPEFRAHQHDQSIFSLLVKKHGLRTDPNLPSPIDPYTSRTISRVPDMSLASLNRMPSLRNLGYWIEYWVLLCFFKILFRLGLRKYKKEINRAYSI